MARVLPELGTGAEQMRSTPAAMLAGLMLATAKRRLPTYIMMVLPDNVAVTNRINA